MKGAVVIMKFCLNITSIGYPSYAEAIKKYPCLGDEKYKMYMTKVWNEDKSIARYITYIDISSMAKLKELIDEESGRAIIDAENDLEWLKQAELVDVKILRKN